MSLPGERKDMEEKCMHTEMSELHENFWSLPCQKIRIQNYIMYENLEYMHSLIWLYFHKSAITNVQMIQVFHIIFVGNPSQDILFFIWKRKIARHILLKELNMHAILKKTLCRWSWGLFKCMEFIYIHVYREVCMSYFFQENNYFKK